MIFLILFLYLKYEIVFANRLGNFQELFLKWKLGRGMNEVGNCLSLNFGHYDSELSIDQISMTLDSKIKLNHYEMNASSNYFIVKIGSKYLKSVDEVMKEANSITNNVLGAKIHAVFLFSKSYQETLTINISDGFERQKPVMVKSNSL